MLKRSHDCPVCNDRQHALDSEEACLLAILATCVARMTAAIHTLSDPTHSKLRNELDMARYACAKATTALREYQEGSRDQGKAGKIE